MERPAVADHADRVLKVISGADAARSALAASWRRSGRLHALDPASGAPSQRVPMAEVAEARERLGPLLRVAQANLDRLFLAVGGVGCSVLLADRDGVVVDRRGAPCDDSTFDGWGLWTGAVWSEKFEGTNGIGTCLVEQRALTIDRDQHFFTRNALLSCTTAPIFDEHGDLAAAIDVSSCRADLTEGFQHLIGMVVADAARAIEAENFRLAFPEARILLDAGGRTGGRVAGGGRQRRPRRRRDARRAADAWPQRAETGAADAGRGSDRPDAGPTATASTPPSAPRCTARWRAPAAMFRGRRRSSTCPARRCTGR